MAKDNGKRCPVIFAVLVVTAFGCGGTGTSPSASNVGDHTIGFAALTSSTVCAFAPITLLPPECRFTSYTESGLTVTAISGAWSVRNDYGNPQPFIQIYQDSNSSRPAAAAVQVTAAGAPFTFRSVDLYASLVPVPYEITGRRNGAIVFTLADTVPNPMGNFKRVANPQTSVAMDALVISLTDGGNAMGIDNVAVNR